MPGVFFRVKVSRNHGVVKTAVCAIGAALLSVGGVLPRYGLEDSKGCEAAAVANAELNRVKVRERVHQALLTDAADHGEHVTGLGAFGYCLGCFAVEVFPCLRCKGWWVSGWVALNRCSLSTVCDDLVTAWIHHVGKLADFLGKGAG